ncbi:MAG: hypothetical protein Q8R08_04865 [bacterium]|nr:hypothetical protein [bacterium]
MDLVTKSKLDIDTLLHNLRNSLTVISGNVHLVKTGKGGPQLLDNISEEVKQISKFLDEYENQ